MALESTEKWRHIFGVCRGSEAPQEERGASKELLHILELSSLQCVASD